MDLALILSALCFCVSTSYVFFIYLTISEMELDLKKYPFLFPLSQGKVSGRLVIRCKLGEGGIPVGDASRLIHQRPPPSHSWETPKKETVQERDTQQTRNKSSLFLPYFDWMSKKCVVCSALVAKRCKIVVFNQSLKRRQKRKEEQPGCRNGWKGFFSVWPW